MKDADIQLAMQALVELLEMQKAYHEKLDKSLLKISVLLSNLVNTTLKKNSK